MLKIGYLWIVVQIVKILLSLINTYTEICISKKIQVTLFEIHCTSIFHKRTEKMKILDISSSYRIEKPAIKNQHNCISVTDILSPA